MATREHVRIAMYELNRRVMVDCYASMNDLCDLLNIKRVSDGEDFGWSDYAEAFYGYRWVDYGLEEKWDEKGAYYEKKQKNFHRCFSSRIR